jgi:hypothetical protein
LIKNIIPLKRNNATESLAQLKKRLCRPKSRCHQFKICEACNRERQRQACDTVELSSKFNRYTTNATVMPFGAGSQSQNQIKKLKSQLLKKLKPTTTGALVSVESSGNDALHLNMIIQSKKRLITSPFDEVSGALNIGVDVLLENVSKADVRNRVAYALKYQSIPSKDRYNGNLVNTTGNVRNAKNAINDYKLFIDNQALAVAIIYKQLLDFGITPPAKKILMLPELYLPNCRYSGLCLVLTDTLRHRQRGCVHLPCLHFQEVHQRQYSTSLRLRRMGKLSVFF